MIQWRLRHPEYAEKQKEASKRFRQKNPEYMYDFNKKWRLEHLQKVREQATKYRINHPEIRAKMAKEYDVKHPERHRAHSANRYNSHWYCCLNCGSTENLQEHHPDYSKPKETVTLCRDCHNNLHHQTNVTLLSVTPPLVCTVVSGKALI